MSVSDIRFKFILVFLLLFPPLLSSYSHAYPDLIYYNNFLTGQSPYTVTLDDFSSFEDTHHWEMYYPTYRGSSQTQYSGIVTSFDTTFMSGATIPSAVPGYDLDLLVGHSFTLPAGNAVVLYSGTGEMTTYSYSTPHIRSSSNIMGIILGTTSPTINDYYPYSGTGTYYEYPDNMIHTSTGDLLNMAIPDKTQDEYMSYRYSNSFQVNNYYNSSIGNHESVSPYSWSYVWLLYNNTESDVTIDMQSWSGELVEVDSIPFENISWIRSIYGYGEDTGNPSSTYNVRGYVLPHIKANIDVYSRAYIMSDGPIFEFLTEYNRLFTFTGILGASPSTTDNNHIYNSFIKFTHTGGVNYKNSVKIPYDLMSTINNYNNLPIFIHTWNAQRSQFPYAVTIKDGWISIDNYSTLVSMLQQAGIGQADLTRVIELLEEINSGGQTGEDTKELMDILEQYHIGIVQQGDNDWATINSQFDSFKYLLDFSGDTIHWIVTANNMLFNYFSGFIILCAFFLVINRILR